MNLCNISSYLLIYIILWHGKKFGSIVYAGSQAADTATGESGTEDENPKSGVSSGGEGSVHSGSVVLSRQASSQSIAQQQLINLDVNVKQNTNEYTYSEEDGVHRFIAKGNRWFSAATKRNVTFWTATDPKQYGKKVVIRKVAGESRFRVYFAVDTPETDEEGLPKRSPKAPKEEPKPLYPNADQLIVLNVKVKESTEEYDYDYDEVEDVHVYEAKEPYLFGIVYKGKVVVWEPGEDGRYPHVAIVLKDEKGDPYLRVFFPEAPVAPKRLVEPKEATTEAEEATEVEEATDVEEATEVEEASEAEVSEPEIEVEEPAPKTPKTQKELKKLLKERMPIMLNIKSKSTNAQYTFSKEGDIGTFTAADSFGFSSVKRENESIWAQQNKNQIAVKVMCDGLGLTSTVRHVTVELIDGTFRHFERNNNVWSVKGNKLRLDVAKRSTTLQYEYLEHHDVGTYTARFDYVFKEVLLGPYCCAAFCSDNVTQIWSGTQNEASKKVVIYLNLCTNRPTFVSVHLSKDKINHYEKRGAFWNLTEPLLELDIEKKDSCYQFYYAGYDEIRSYSTNHNFLFTRVLEGTTEIWRGQKNRYATMVLMNGDGETVAATKLAIVLKNGKKLYFNKDRGPWAKGDGFPAFELDLDDTFSTDYVDYVEDSENKTASYETKHGFVFRSVVQDGIIWSADKAKDYGIKVYTAEDKNVVKIFSASGKVRQFSRPEAGQPWSEVKVSKLPQEKGAKKKKEVEDDLVIEDERESVKGMVLDVTKQESTDKYTYKRRGEKEIYIANEGHKFKGIQVGKSPSANDKIFTAADIEEFVEKVVLDRSDDPGFINDVMLHMVDGTKKQFVKVGASKRWCEVVTV